MTELTFLVLCMCLVHIITMRKWQRKKWARFAKFWWGVGLPAPHYRLTLPFKEAEPNMHFSYSDEFFQDRADKWSWQTERPEDTLLLWTVIACWLCEPVRIICILEPGTMWLLVLLAYLSILSRPLLKEWPFMKMEVLSWNLRRWELQ